MAMAGSALTNSMYSRQVPCHETALFFARFSLMMDWKSLFSLVMGGFPSSLYITFSDLEKHQISQYFSILPGSRPHHRRGRPLACTGAAVMVSAEEMLGGWAR